MQASLGRISFTSDVWDTASRRAFVGVTGHWIGRDAGTKDLQMRSAILGFQRLEGRHEGKRIADVVLGILERVNLLGKVSLS